MFAQLQYKTERDGVVETRVEQKITIQSDGDPIDHDKALAEAIQVANWLCKQILISAKSAARHSDGIFVGIFNFTGGHGNESRYDGRKNWDPATNAIGAHERMPNYGQKSLLGHCKRFACCMMETNLDGQFGCFF